MAIEICRTVNVLFVSNSHKLRTNLSDWRGERGTLLKQTLLYGQKKALFVRYFYFMIRSGKSHCRLAALFRVSAQTGHTHKQIVQFRCYRKTGLV